MTSASRCSDALTAAGWSARSATAGDPTLQGSCGRRRARARAVALMEGRLAGRSGRARSARGGGLREAGPRISRNLSPTTPHFVSLQLCWLNRQHRSEGCREPKGDRAR